MARVIMMTDFSESYAHKLLRGIVDYSHDHTPWVVCKMPLMFRDENRMAEVVKFAKRWKADAIIGQFSSENDVDIFRRNGIIAIAQDYQQRFEGISNISGNYLKAGQICADYFIKRGLRNFAFYGRGGFVWSDGRREGFKKEIMSRVPDFSFSAYEKVSSVWWYDTDSVSRWLVNLPKPVGVLASDDNLAYNIDEVCRMADRDGMRIPQDILLLGVDNDEDLCQLSSPPLSSLNQEVEKAGYDTARLIDELLSLPVSERFSHSHDIIVHPGQIYTRRSTNAFIYPNKYVSQVVQYIHSNLEKEISVDELVELVPMSRRLLEETFRKDVGTSIYKYIIIARIEKMKDLMIQGMSPSEAVGELALDYKIMARNFRNVTGRSPSEFADALAAQKRSPEDSRAF